MARQSDFTPELGEEFCERIADGASLRKVCAQKGMPDQRTIRRWLLKGELEPESDFGPFRRQYARAREQQADVYAERIVDEAESATDAALGRLRMDALKWAASKLAPKRYGDKLAIGGDADAPPIKTVTRIELVGVRPSGDPAA